MTDISHGRGYYGESRLAKKVNGVIVGRSKAVVLPTGETIEITHQHPPDVVNSMFAFESKYTRQFPKKISDYMLQAETNCPDGLTPVAVVKDPYRKTYYYILRESDFVELHCGGNK